MIRDHEINPANASITIAADEPSQGNASHVYTVTAQDGTQLGVLRFQNGPIKAADYADVIGVNGLTHEVLLAIILDRLRGFQSSPYACDENKTTMELLQLALDVQKERTLKRMARGVEGTHAV